MEEFIQGRQFILRINSIEKKELSGKILKMMIRHLFQLNEVYNAGGGCNIQIYIYQFQTCIIK